MPEFPEAYEWPGRAIIGSDGEKIGKITEIYVDGQTGKPAWATVTSGLLDTESRFVPLAGALLDGESVRTRVTKDQVRDAPGVEDDGELSEQEEARLLEHYGISYTQDGSLTAQGQPNAGERRETEKPTAGHDASGPTTDDAITRSEEELQVGTRRQAVGRVRLRKRVVTEMVTKTVPVSHEEITIEREAITDANRGAVQDGGELSDEEHEIVLYAEELVVEKRVVAKERIRIGKETVTEDREISEEIRKEQIETNGIAPTGHSRGS